MGRGSLVQGTHRTMEGGCVLIEDGIELSMAHIRVLGIQGIPSARELCPGQLAVWASSGEAIVPDSQDDLVPAHYACPNLQDGMAFVRDLTADTGLCPWPGA